MDYGVGRARAPGTCGEFVQGSVGGVDLLISCPIGWYAEAVVWLEKGDGPISVASPLPAGGGRKALEALRRTLDYVGADVSGVLRINSPLPPGKGLGSSTADIVATVHAALRALGREMLPEEVARVALSVEPSDGVMFPGLVLLDHRRGTTMRPLGAPPPMGCLVLDLGGEVATEEFNRRADLAELNARKEPEVRRALKLILRGLDRGDPWLVGEGATISALAHQSILPRQGLEEIVGESERFGAYGVVAAHSGTVVGVLLPPDGATAKHGGEVFAAKGFRVLGWVQVVPGGAR